jgi:subtilisin family serine protease
MLLIADHSTLYGGGGGEGRAVPGGKGLRLAVLVMLAGLVVALVATPAAAAAYTPATDVGSLYNTTLMTGAQAYWKAGYTGKGIDVAVVDSGVARCQA